MIVSPARALPRLLLLLVLTCGLVACAHRPPVSGPSVGLAEEARPGLAVAEPRELGRSVEGRPLVAHALGSGSTAVAIVATIHGDEWAGTPLLAELERFLHRHPDRLEGLTLHLLPMANPDGFAARRRTNARGVDLNRNYPAANHRASDRHGAQPLSEPEARALASWIETVAPRLVVSLHQPLECVDWDGPAEALARRMAAASGLPARKLGSRPGSLGSWVGVDRQTPIITVELPRGIEWEAPEVLFRRYGPMLLTALASARAME